MPRRVSSIPSVPSTDESSVSVASIMDALNAAQLKAVKHAPETPLQILAGPGSGKTKVLTSRIAYLILVHSLPPSSICAVTFTNKAANEMRERLVKLIGKQRTSEVKMGTFHALCTRFLRKHAKLVGLKENFTICDADESKKIITALLKTHKDFLSDKDFSLKEGTVLSHISKAKAKGLTAAEFLVQVEVKHRKSKKKDVPDTSQLPYEIECIVADIYDEYERTLKRSNSLDFDDLLLRGVKLFKGHDRTVEWCKHVLVDEFQDTNITQYELMSAIAVARCVTIVGDPDQSIYGWRSAEVENLAKMRKDFPTTEQIFLEENYRSTSTILNASLAIVAQDKLRIQKSLHTSHPTGLTPVLRSFPSEYAEAAAIAVEIKRLVANMGGVLRWGDFVILLRFNALSRAIESALQKETIPSRVLAGHKFFERMEIKDLLSYLQLIDNPNYTPAFARAVNVPSRSIGEKTLAEIASRATKTELSHLEVVERIDDSRSPDIKPPVKRKLGPFLKMIRVLRNLADQGASPADLIRMLLDSIEYQDHLRKTQPDWESRWENVQELITFASEVETEILDTDRNSAEESAEKVTPLRSFLQASMLSSEGDNQSEVDSKEKVTITTCHAAKGLEWPVVMVPAVEQGTFPFYRTEDVEEERRLLYVACTRAQGLLYLSYTTARKFAGETKSKQLSEFVSAVTKQNHTLFSDRKPQFLPSDRATLSKVLNRSEPDTSEVARRVAEFDRNTRHHAPDEQINQYINSSWHPALPGTPQVPITTTFITPSALLNAPIKSSYASKPTQPTTIQTTITTATRTTVTHPVSRIYKPTLTQHPRPAVYSPPDPLQHRHDIPTISKPATVNSNIPTVTSLSQTSQDDASYPAPQKRRLGMGRVTAGYSNKKFKRPT